MTLLNLEEIQLIDTKPFSFNITRGSQDVVAFRRRLRDGSGDDAPVSPIDLTGFLIKIDVFEADIGINEPLEEGSKIVDGGEKWSFSSADTTNAYVRIVDPRTGTWSWVIPQEINTTDTHALKSGTPNSYSRVGQHKTYLVGISEEKGSGANLIKRYYRGALKIHYNPSLAGLKGDTL